MPVPEQLRTARLLLRTPQLSDAEAIFANYATDPKVTRYLVWRPHADLAQTRTFLESRLKGWETGQALAWAITLPPDDRCIGMIDLRLGTGKADIGYVLSRAYWGRGLMTEAVRAVVDTAFRLPDIYRVWAVCDVDNVASARVLEKAGMEFEGILRRWVLHPGVNPVPRDCRCYAKVTPDRPRAEG